MYTQWDSETGRQTDWVWETGNRHAQIYLYLANFQRLLTKLSTKCNAKRNKIVQEAEAIEAASRGDDTGKQSCDRREKGDGRHRQRERQRQRQRQKGNGKEFVRLRIRTDNTHMRLLTEATADWKKFQTQVASIKAKLWNLLRKNRCNLSWRTYLNIKITLLKMYLIYL